MNRSLRIVRMSRRQAWPWRWELALLELGSQRRWRLPDAAELKAHAQRLGLRMQAGEVPAVLAFDGYTLVGACWRDAAGGDFGPCAIPCASALGLEARLLRLLSAGSAEATAVPNAGRARIFQEHFPPSQAVQDQDRPGIAQIENEASAVPMAVAASTSLG